MEQKKSEDVTFIRRGNVHTLVSAKNAPGKNEGEPQKSQEPQAKISRRTLIKGLAGALAFGAAYMLEKKVFGSGGKAKEAESENLASEVGRLKNRTESSRPETAAFDYIAHDLSQVEKGVARSIVDEMRYEVLEEHSSFDGMMAVTRKFESNIRSAAKANNIPEDLALGIVFIENGGAEDLTSPAGARGPAQLMPGTARRFGVRVDVQVDERVDPTKAFGAMCQYLATMRNMFGGDAGIATWGYHAGEGNVYDALWVYFKDKERADLGNFLAATSSEEAQAIAKAYSEKISQSKVSVHKILANEAVKSKVLNFLGDETELYPYKAVAAAEILSS